MVATNCSHVFSPKYSFFFFTFQEFLFSTNAKSSSKKTVKLTSSLDLAVLLFLDGHVVADVEGDDGGIRVEVDDVARSADPLLNARFEDEHTVSRVVDRGPVPDDPHVVEPDVPGSSSRVGEKDFELVDVVVVARLRKSPDPKYSLHFTSLRVVFTMLLSTLITTMLQSSSRLFLKVSNLCNSNRM